MVAALLAAPAPQVAAAHQVVAVPRTVADSFHTPPVLRTLAALIEMAARRMPAGHCIVAAPLAAPAQCIAVVRHTRPAPLAVAAVHNTAAVLG